MASSDKPARRRPSSSGGGGGWLFVLLLVGAVAAVMVFAPDLPRQLIGAAKKPAGDGPEPTTAQDSSATLSKRDVTASTRLADTSAIDRTLGSGATKLATPKPDAPKPEAPKPVAPDEAAAQKLLAAAEDAYKTFKWDKAGSTANSIVTMDVKPATKVRAKDIVRGALAMAKLFKELDEKDELTRNYDTHPSLVAINTNGQVTYGVPIVSLEEPTVVEKDPIGWINGQRKTGKVTLLMRGKKDFIATSMPADKIGEIAPVDLAAVAKDKQDEFVQRLDRMRNGDMAKNALAWYDAAKFAYRNRLDEHVTEMMDQALLLDPMLVSSVREDRAATLFANVVVHMKNNNQKQAAAFIAIINKRFADTPSGKQAKLFYEGKTAELMAASREAEAKARDDEKQRREARMARAKELGDEKAVAQIAKEPESAPDTDLQQASSAATGDEGQADEFFAKGKDFYSQAIDAGNTDNRDVLYTKALDQFTKAMAIYNKLLEKAGDDSPVAMKALECNKLRFGSIKQRRFH